MYNFDIFNPQGIVMAMEPKDLKVFKSKEMKKDEKIISFVNGYIGEMLGVKDKELINGILILTNQRIVFFSRGFLQKGVLKYISIKDISSIDRRSKGLVNVLNVNNIIEFKTTDTKKEQQVHQEIEKTMNEQIIHLSEDERIEALKKYGELRDSGVITQDDFQNKKNEILLNKKAVETTAKEEIIEEKITEKESTGKNISWIYSVLCFIFFASFFSSIKSIFASILLLILSILLIPNIYNKLPLNPKLKKIGAISLFILGFIVAGVIDQKETLQYYNENKNSIIKDIKVQFSNKMYEEALNIANTYYSASSDQELEVLISDIKQQKRVNEILSKLKVTPDSKLKEKMDLYFELTELDPSSKEFKDNYNHYKELYSSAMAYINKHGEMSDYLAEYVVKDYLKSIAHDPDSIKISRCSSGMQGDYGWAVACTYHARNGFGGIMKYKAIFIISNQQVIKVIK